jgi:uncharacterized protein YyaL (SSP411 family)
MNLIYDFLNKFWNFIPVDIESKNELKRESKIVENNFNDETHLLETINWLCRAQDSSQDKGVSRSFKMAKFKGYGPSGWQASYPETTGYIVPTMIEAGIWFNNDSLKQRAIDMANWEIEILMPSGAVMGSVVTAKPSPAVFNTGQVIFGWLAVFRETHDNKYLDAAKKAGDYIVSVQDLNGLFDSGDSQFALKGATTYNARVAWALAELGQVAQEKKYSDAARKNIDSALSKQNQKGWFSDNCLNDPNSPLLHTIVYTTRGIIETGLLLNESRYIGAAIKALDALLECQRPNGGIPGRLDKNWKTKVDWDCLTGNAQLSIAWLRAHSVTGDIKYKNAARKAIDFVKKTQNLNHKNPGIRGGVKGSFPFDAEYGQFEFLNWAAKFFCDALLMLNDETLAKKGIPG